MGKKSISKNPFEVEDYIYRLANANEAISFSIKTKTIGKVQNIILKYEDNRKERFYNIISFLNALQLFYRNRIDFVEDHTDKITICNQCIDELEKHKRDLADKLYEKDNFIKEANEHIVFFKHLKNRFIEEKNNIRETSVQLTTIQIILLLDFLGVFEYSTSLSKVALSRILSSITGKNEKNLVDSIRDLEKYKAKKNFSKQDFENYNTILTVLKKAKADELIRQVEDKIKQIELKM